MTKHIIDSELLETIYTRLQDHLDQRAPTMVALRLVLQEQPAADCGLEVVAWQDGNDLRHSQSPVPLIRKSDADARIAELKAQRDELAKMLSEVTESYGSCTTYNDEDDEIGDRACCGVISYAPHKDHCIVVKAKAALSRVEVKPNE